jgi:hypothetical protein
VRGLKAAYVLTVLTMGHLVVVSAGGVFGSGWLYRDNAGDVDVATIVLGAGFTLLRLTGQIDTEGRRLVLAALDVLQGFYGPRREIDLMRRDLMAFA